MMMNNIKAVKMAAALALSSSHLHITGVTMSFNKTALVICACHKHSATRLAAVSAYWKSKHRSLPQSMVHQSYFTSNLTNASKYKLPNTSQPHSNMRDFSSLVKSKYLPVLSSVREIHQKNARSQAYSKHFILSAQDIVKASPAAVQPYMRLMRIDRPIGTWLLFLPCTWSISLAAPPGALPDPTMLTLFALGSFFMRGAGCTINDMWDKDFDSKVARTKDRPLACGEINYFRALVFLGAQLSVSLAILLTFNWNTIILGACSVIPCVIYPLMKRVTYWPQIFLGITLNWGVLIAWSAIHGSITLPGALLYGACLLHTTFYDTVYSHQDKEDDILVGVKSTALGLGAKTKPWLAGFSSFMVAGLTGAGYMCEQTWPYYAGVAYVGAHLARQIYKVDLDNPDDCGKHFRSNRNLGLVFWAAIVAGNLLRTKDDDKKKEEPTEKLME